MIIARAFLVRLLISCPILTFAFAQDASVALRQTVHVQVEKRYPELFELYKAFHTHAGTLLYGRKDLDSGC